MRQIDKLGMAHSAAIAAGKKAGLEAFRGKAASASVRAVGVLPDPPTVKLPMQITAASMGTCESFYP
jgi:hypothetical protein